MTDQHLIDVSECLNVFLTPSLLNGLVISQASHQMCEKQCVIDIQQVMINFIQNGFICIHPPPSHNPYHTAPLLCASGSLLLASVPHTGSVGCERVRVSALASVAR